MKSKQALIDEVVFLGRGWSTAAVLFHTALAAKQGLSPSEEKVLELLERDGPMTAGALSSSSGLAPASITGLIDRLEEKGFARRVKDDDDGRRVKVAVDAGRTAALAEHFGDLVGEFRDALAGYSVAELEVVRRFVVDATRVQQASTTKLTAKKVKARGAKRRRRRPETGLRCRSRR